MDMLSPAEKAEVEGYLAKHPDLQTELREIERSLELYAMTAAKAAPGGLKDKILNEIRDNTAQGGSSSNPPLQGGSGILKFIATLLGLGVLLFGYLFFQKNNELNSVQDEYSALRDSCAQSTQELTSQLDILRQLTYPDNKILPFTATPGFAITDLYLHHNAVTKRNFIQVRNLPALAANQSFQLWSLKPNQAPAPLTVFEIPSNGLIEVQFEDGTDTYAITIEPKGGRETPTLENLIGTVSVAGI